MVDGPVFEHEGTEPGPVTGISRCIGSASRRDLLDHGMGLLVVHDVTAALVVVFYGALSLLFFGKGDTVVVVEVALF